MSLLQIISYKKHALCYTGFIYDKKQLITDENVILFLNFVRADNADINE